MDNSTLLGFIFLAVALAVEFHKAVEDFESGLFANCVADVVVRWQVGYAVEAVIQFDI